MLLLTDDAVLSTGQIIRARAEAPRGFTAESQRERAALAGAARRGGFDEGQTVHVGWQVLDTDAVAAGAASGPLSLQTGVPSVRWSAAGGWVPLAGYLDERIALLAQPPLGRELTRTPARGLRAGRTGSPKRGAVVKPARRPRRLRSVVP